MPSNPSRNLKQLKMLPSPENQGTLMLLMRGPLSGTGAADAHDARPLGGRPWLPQIAPKKCKKHAPLQAGGRLEEAAALCMAAGLSWVMITLRHRASSTTLQDCWRPEACWRRQSLCIARLCMVGVQSWVMITSINNLEGQRAVGGSGAPVPRSSAWLQSQARR